MEIKTILLLAWLLVFAPVSVYAEVDSGISEMVTDATTVFSAIKALVIAVVGFFVVLGFVKLVKKSHGGDGELFDEEGFYCVASDEECQAYENDPDGYMAENGYSGTVGNSQD